MSHVRKMSPVAIQYNPFLSLQSEFGRFAQNFRGLLEPFNFPIERFENITLTPNVDIIDEKDCLKFKVEMPGMEEKDIHVSISEGFLTIKGEKTTSKEDKDKNYMIREIKHGSYERRVLLPDYIDGDKAKAMFKEGVILVEIPKKLKDLKKSRVLEISKS